MLATEVVAVGVGLLLVAATNVAVLLHVVLSALVCAVGMYAAAIVAGVAAATGIPPAPSVGIAVGMAVAVVGRSRY